MFFSHTNTEIWLYRLMNKEILPKDIAQGIIFYAVHVVETFHNFVAERICGEVSLFDRIKKNAVPSWNSNPGKDPSFSLSIEHATTGLFSRMLMLVRSSRDLYLSQVISRYELSS